MKKLFLFSLSLMFILSVQSIAQDSDQTDPMMKAWMEYMTPGQTHEMLAQANGSWTAKSTMWMMPESEPMETEGTMTNEMILGGRYQKSTFTGNMMGMPFEGMSLLAFDNASKEFYSIWIDNMGTGMMMSKGKYDEGSKMVNMKGTYVDPMTGNEEPFRQTFQVVDENHHVMEMFMNMEGKEYTHRFYSSVKITAVERAVFGVAKPRRL
jgi:hypothetical protein